MNNPGKRIKEERENQGWSQQKLADEIARIKGHSISRAAVAKWEIGSSKTQTPANFFAAAEALGLNPYWVLDGTGEKYARHVTGNQPANPPEIQQGTATYIATLPKAPSKRDAALAEVARLAGLLDEAGLHRLIERASVLLENHALSSTKQTRKSS